MAYDEGLAHRIRDHLDGVPGVRERKMFGGLAFMVAGHMCVGIMGDELMVRGGAGRNDELLARPHARVMDFTGKPMKGFVIVDIDGIAEDDQLGDWIDDALDFVQTLPPK